MKHLFDHWSEISSRLSEAPRLLVMLDFDGTLSPIVKHPDLATLPPETRTRLVELRAAPGVSLAIISGRSVADLRQRVAIENITYVGNHGRELRRPGASEPETDSEIQKRMEEVAGHLTKELSEVPGIIIENKGFTVAVHYRQIPESLRPRVRSCTQGIAKQMAGLIEVSEGKCVYDLFPSDGANKGKAALALLEEHGGLPKVLPIYCGDDTTDETVFRTLPAGSVTVYVGDAQAASAARYRLADPGEVASLLKRISLPRRRAAKPPRR